MKLLEMTPVENIKAGDVICATWRVTATRATAKRIYFTIEDATTDEPRETYHQCKGSNISRWDLDA